MKIGSWQYDWLIWAFDSGIMSTLQGAEAKVLMCLLSHANKSGASFPSPENVAKKCGINSKSFYRCLKKLLSHDKKFLRKSDKKDGRRYGTYIFDLKRSTDYAPVLINQAGEKLKIPDDDGSLFGGYEAYEAASSFGFSQHECINLVTRYGVQAVIDGINHVEWVKEHGKMIAGRPVENRKKVLISHLQSGYKLIKREEKELEENKISDDVVNQKKLEKRDMTLTNNIIDAMSDERFEEVRQELIDNAPTQQLAKSYAKMPKSSYTLRDAIVSFLMKKI